MNNTTSNTGYHYRLPIGRPSGSPAVILNGPHHLKIDVPRIDKKS